MFAVRGRTGAPDRARGARATAVFGVLASIVATVLFATPAQAGSIAEKRAEARAAYSHLQGMEQDLEVVIQRYDAARVRLQQTETRVHDNQARLRVARANLGASMSDLQGSLIAAYKGDHPDVIQTVLAAHSLSSMVDQVDLYQRATRYNATVLQRVQLYKRQVLREKRLLAVEQRHRQQAVAEQARRRTEVRQGIARQHAYLDSLNREIRRLVIERRNYLRQLAIARARAAAAAFRATRATENVTIASGVGGDVPVATSPADGGATSGGGTTVAPPASSLGARAAQIALGEQGVPYVWGGASPSGFDCSGLVIWAYAAAGRPGLPHYTGSLWSSGVHVSTSDMAPGDLVFFHGLSHVGIYIGGGQFVHAPHTGDVVKISSLSESWYSSGFDGAVRITG